MLEVKKLNCLHGIWAETNNKIKKLCMQSPL